MERIEIPNNLIPKLGPSMAMDTHWIDVYLRNGKVYRKLVVRGGRYITGVCDSEDGVSDLDFLSSDILDIKRPSLFSWLMYCPRRWLK